MKWRLITLLSGLAIILTVLCPQARAQEELNLRKKAEELFNECQYARAAVLYQRLTDTPYPILTDIDRVATCYMKMNRYEDAEIWYARVAEDPQSSSESLFHYGEILKANARYQEAKKVLQRYLARTGDRKRAVAIIAGCDSAMIWISNPTSHVIKNEEKINTERSEFSVCPIGEQSVCFVGEPVVSTKLKEYGWTGSSYLRIFSAGRMPDNTLNSRALSNIIYNKEHFHVGPISTNKAGNIYFITRTSLGKKSELSRIDGRTYRTQNMELYIQAKIYGQWQPPKPFIYNDVQKYSLGHAVLSKDEKVLYFISDKPGGLGGTDIWYSELKPDGTWGPCHNAGDVINTPGDEMFPTIAPDGTLYFSSNGLPGMGELDIFSSKGSRYQWSKPVNMRYPVNSPGDDFSYILNDDLRGGYLSSNRVNGKGGDDIYSFFIPKSNNILSIEGFVYDKKTRKILPEADVVLYDANRTILAKQISNPDGTFLFRVEKRDLYRLKGSKNSYYPDTTSIRITAASGSSEKVALYLDPLFEKGKTFKLENILYNFDKDNIRRDASIILDGLVKIMHENPTLNIELASHTDCRGTDAYNQNLSQRRAQSAVDYLVSRGISRSRMVAKGYGESRLINRCADGVSCSEAEHQENRRTEFTVTSY